MYTADTIFKSTPLRLEAADETKGIIEAYWSAFDLEDSQGDTMRRGHFKKTIKTHGPKGNNSILHLWQHEWWEKPIGKPKELIEDTFGLRVVSQLSMTTAGRDVLRLYQDGVITQHSVGMNVFRDKEGAIKGVGRLFEGSAVNWAANEHTPTISVKSNGQGDVPYSVARAQVEAMRKALASSEISEELGWQMELALGLITEQIDLLTPADVGGDGGGSIFKLDDSYTQSEEAEAAATATAEIIAIIDEHVIVSTIKRL